MPIITPPVITKQRAVLPTKQCFLAEKHRMATSAAIA